MVADLERLLFRRHPGGQLPEEVIRQLQERGEGGEPEPEERKPEEEERKRDVVFRVEPNPIDERPSLNGLPEIKEREGYKIWFDTSTGGRTFWSAVFLLPQLGLQAGKGFYNRVQTYRDPIERTRREREKLTLRYDREDKRVLTQRDQVDAFYKDQLSTKPGVIETDLEAVIKNTGGLIPDQRTSATPQTTHDQIAFKARKAVETHRGNPQKIVHVAEEGMFGGKRRTEIGLAFGTQMARLRLGKQFEEQSAQVLADPGAQNEVKQILGTKGATPPKVMDAVYAEFPPPVATGHKKRDRLFKDLDYGQKLIAEALETGGELLRDPSIGAAIEILHGKGRTETIETILAAARGESGGANRAYASRLLQTLEVTEEELAAVIDPQMNEIDEAIQGALYQYGQALEFTLKVFPTGSGKIIGQQALDNLLQLATEDTPRGQKARKVLSELAPDMSRQVEEYLTLLEDAATPGTGGKLRGKGLARIRGQTPEASLGLTSEEILFDKTQNLITDIVQGGYGARALLALMPGLKVSGTTTPAIKEVSENQEAWSAIIEAFRSELFPGYETDEITRDLITPGGLIGSALIAGGVEPTERAILDALIFRHPQSIGRLEGILASSRADTTGKIGTKDANESLIEAAIATANAELAVPSGEYDELPPDCAETMVLNAAKTLVPGILELRRIFGKKEEEIEKDSRLTQAQKTGLASATLAAALARNTPLPFARIVAKELMEQTLSDKNPKKGPLALMSELRSVIGAALRHKEIDQHPAIERELSGMVGRILRDIYNRRLTTISELAARKDKETGQLITLVGLLPDGDLPVPSGEIPLIGLDMKVSDMFDLEALTQQPQYQPGVDRLQIPGFKGVTKQKACLALTHFLIGELDLATVAGQRNLSLTEEAAAYQRELDQSSTSTEPQRRSTQAIREEEVERGQISLTQALKATRVLKLEDLALYHGLLKPLYQMAGLILVSRPEAGETDVGRTSVIITDTRPVHPLVRDLNHPLFRKDYPRGYESFRQEIAAIFAADAPPVDEEGIKKVQEKITMLKNKIEELRAQGKL